MKTKSLLVVLFSIILLGSNYAQVISGANAQDTTKNKNPFIQKYKWGFGIGAGFTTGWGLSLKYQPRKDGIQINTLPYINNNTKQKLIDVGLTYTHDLWDGPGQ